MARLEFLVPMAAVLLAAACGGGAGRPVAQSAGKTDAEEECLHGANVDREKPKDPGPIGLSHILVKHRDVSRVDASITRTRGQACLHALAALQKLKHGANWDQVEAEYSDGRGAAGGALGEVSEDMLEKTFAAAAYELEPDQISYVVETRRGFHVIHRLH